MMQFCNHLASYSHASGVNIINNLLYLYQLSAIILFSSLLWRANWAQNIIEYYYSSQILVNWKVAGASCHLSILINQVSKSVFLSHNKKGISKIEYAPEFFVGY